MVVATLGKIPSEGFVAFTRTPVLEQVMCQRKG